jgi:hypothetical protein
MKETHDGYYSLTGTLDSMADGVTRSGKLTIIEYIVVDGVKWGNIVVLGSLSELVALKGKEVELQFAHHKARLLLGLREKGQTEYHTANKVMVDQMKSELRIKAVIGPVFLAIVSGYFFFLFGGATGIFLCLALLFATHKLMDITEGGKLTRNAVRFLKQYDTVQ